MILGFGAGRCGTKTLAKLLDIRHEEAIKKGFYEGLFWKQKFTKKHFIELMKYGDVGYYNIDMVEDAIKLGCKVIYLKRNFEDHVKSWLKFIETWDGQQLWQNKGKKSSYAVGFPTYPDAWSLEQCIREYLEKYDNRAKKLIEKHKDIIVFKTEDLSNEKKIKQLYKKLGINKEVKIIKTNQTPKRKNAVLVACGKNSIHHIYTTPEREYDVIELAYEPINSIGDMYFEKKDYKFSLIYDFIKENINTIKAYDNLLFIDDDILLQTQQINEIFRLAKDYNLELFHPAMNPLNFDHAPNMYPLENTFIHTQTWSEICCIGMKTNTALQLLETFKQSKSGWGLPDIWSNYGKVYNILDTIQAVHTKEMGGELYDELGGLHGAYKEYLNIIKSNPKKEFKILRKIYLKPILSIFTIYRDEDEKYLEEYLNTVPDFAEKIIIKTVPFSQWQKYIDNGLAPKMYDITIKKSSHNLTTGIMYVPDELTDRDFSKMKNKAKELCNSEWVLNLDIDERLLNHQFNKLREWLENPANHRNVGGYYVTNLSLMPSAIDEKTKLGSRVAVPACRLFRKKFDFEDNIHETPDRNIQKSGMKINDSILIIHHVGYEKSSEELLQKAERNLKMLWKNPELINKKEKFDYMINTAIFYKQMKGN